MTRRGRLALAALVSAALHTMVISGDWIPLPQPPGEPRPLLARLAPLPGLEPAPPPPRARVRKPRRAAPAPPVETIAAASPFVLPEPDPDEAPAEEVAQETAAPEPPQKLALAAEPSAAAARSLPRRGRITFSLLYGDEGTFVGEAVQSWEVEADSYKLASEAHTAGFVELFRPQRLRYMSQGKVTPAGLQPESFLISRTRRGRTEAAVARFDWSAGSLTYGYAREQKQAALPAGTQDLMSFVYQYVIAPPAPGRYRVPITTGAGLEVYEVDVAPEQDLVTPVGTVRALPVRQVARPGEESVEVWLAADYRYLPVRVRHFDRQGNYAGEQLVSEIRVSDEQER